MAPNLSKFVTKRNVISAVAGVSVILWLLKKKKQQRKSIPRKQPLSDIQYMIGEFKHGHSTKKEDQIQVIRFLWAKGVPGAEIHQRLTTLFEDSTLQRRSVSEWIEKFKAGQDF